MGWMHILLVLLVLVLVVMGGWCGWFDGDLGFKKESGRRDIIGTLGI
jgi:hypothetical protein